MRNLRKNTENLNIIGDRIDPAEKTLLLLSSDEEAIEYLLDRLSREYNKYLDWYLSTLREREESTAIVVIRFCVCAN